MADETTIARPYAEAIFKQAKENSALDSWSSILTLLASIAGDEQTIALLKSPRVEKKKAGDFFIEVAGDTLTEQAKNLIHLLADNRRLILLPEIARQFEVRRKLEQGCVTIELISCYNVTPKQQEELSATLSRKLGKEVQVDVAVDKTLLGGWLIKHQDKVIDLTIRGRLTQLAANL